MPDSDGRLVAVMGAGGALGAALARAYVAAGAAVLGLDRTVPESARQIDGVEYRAVDVLDDAGLAACFDDVAPPWAVVNVVGGFAGHRPFPDLDADELKTQLMLNVASAALITKHSLRRMLAAGQGRLVHTASRVALVSEGTNFAYSVSKLGVLHLVEMAAAETHGTGITVNAVVPSIMDTPANRAAMPGAPHERWPKVDDVAAVYLFLTSPAAHLVSGAAIPVYGLT